MMNPFMYGCVVEGEYFCQRDELERELRDYAERGQNVVIQGERRMGKTSLVRKAVSSLRGKRRDTRRLFQTLRLISFRSLKGWLN